jgi:hypothetical protein
MEQPVMQYKNFTKLYFQYIYGNFPFYYFTETSQSSLLLI